MRKRRIISKKEILKVFWPEICPFCGKASRIGICERCRKKIGKLTIKEPWCLKCGKPIRYKEQEYCQDCAHVKHDYDKGRALWIHKEPVNVSLYKFKFHNQRNFGIYYAEALAHRYGELLEEWQPEIIVPVPLHPKKCRIRGFNQAEVVAAELGRLVGIPVNTELVRRVCYTNPQKELDPQKRKRNLQDAFKVEKQVKKDIGIRKILLVDDIYTTGSTMDAIARVLKEEGAEKVYYLTISIGQGY